MDLYQIKRFYHTLKDLKFTQVYHQIKYRFVKPKRVATPWEGSFAQVDLVAFPEKQTSISLSNDVWSFRFLNLEKSFSEESLDWSFADYGMLWTYNLNYFDWLHQPDLSKERGLETLSKFYDNSAEKNPIILHPYPTSLRIINTAKFVSNWDINDNGLYSELVSDLKFLSGRLEYHLLANHLLENAFALYIGGLVTNQNKFTQKGKKLLIRELKEQILNDGMHYERSPMYHLIILERLLDALNFAKAVKDDLEPVLKSYAVSMTALSMNWKNLDRVPMMQDSAYDIALSVSVILEYANNLLGEEYPSKPSEMNACGYRTLESDHFTIIANVGKIGPSYQPGHAHADELNFELFYKGSPIIVDTGVSTYEKNERRQLERSTESHNSVSVNSTNTSDVWSGFRVGRRSDVSLIKDMRHIIATHNTYNPLIINRTWSIDSSVANIQDVLQDVDEFIYYSPIFEAKGRLHIHPDYSIKLLDSNSLCLSNGLIINFESPENTGEVSIEEYQYAQGYNHTRLATVITYKFSSSIKISIREANSTHSLSYG
jgi:hypothetical protein